MGRYTVPYVQIQFATLRSLLFYHILRLFRFVGVHPGKPSFYVNQAVIGRASYVFDGNSIIMTTTAAATKQDNRNINNVRSCLLVAPCSCSNVCSYRQHHSPNERNHDRSLRHGSDTTHQEPQPPPAPGEDKRPNGDRPSSVRGQQPQLPAGKDSII